MAVLFWTRIAVDTAKKTRAGGLVSLMKSPLHFAGPTTCARRAAFTLVEVLVVIVIIAVLAAFAFPSLRSMMRNGDQTAGLSNMRQIGAAFVIYASEHDSQLPNPAQRKPTLSWPKALGPYLKDVRVFAAPGKQDNYIKRKVDPLSEQPNNTSFIMNGFNDIGTWKNPNGEVRLINVSVPSDTLLLGMQKSGSRHFYMDFLEPPHGNAKDLLDLRAYGEGSNYLFVDGSSRFISAKDYRDELWLADKAYIIPQM